MKNLKINSNKIKAILGTIVLTTNLAACSFTNSDNKESNVYTLENNILDTEGLEYIVVNNKLIKVSDLALMDKDGNIVKSVDNVVVDNKLMKIENPVDIKFDSNIENVVVGNELVSPSEFKLVNAKTKEEITSIDSFILNGELVDASSLLSLNGNSNSSETSVNEEYEELTEEKFNEIVASKVNECRLKGISFNERDVESLVLLININRLAVDNADLIYKVLGGYNLTEVEIDDFMLNADNLLDAFNSYNCNLFRATKSTNGYILISDMVFDPIERSKAQQFEAKVNEIGSYSRSDVSKMNQLIYDFLPSLYYSTSEIYEIESGVCFGLRNTLRPIRDVYGRNECEDAITLDSINADFIKYFVSYVGDENEYYINGWGTGAWENVFGLLRNNCSKTLTK